MSLRPGYGWRKTAGYVLQNSRVRALADQALFSAVAFLQVFVFARVMTTTEFGVFSLALSAGLVATGLQRSGVVLPMIVLFPTPTKLAGAYKWELSQAALAIGATAVLAILAASVLSGEYATAAGAAAVFMAPALYYEFQRRWLFQIGKRGAAVICAAVYAVTNAIGVLGVALLMPNALGAAIGLALGAGAAGLTARFLRGPLPTGQRERAPDAGKWEALSLAGWNVLSFAPYALYNNAMPLVVGLVAGPTTVALFAAARVFLTPVQMLVSAVDSVDKPRANRAFAELGSRGLARSLSDTQRLLFALGLPYLIVAALLADPLTHLALGVGYADQPWTARLWLVVAAMMMLGLPQETGLVTLRRPDLVFWIRCLAALAAICGTLALTPRFGAAGAVAALATGWSVSAVAAGFMLRSRLRAGDEWTETSMKNLYIAWIGFQRRAEAMKDPLGYELVHLPSPASRRWQKPFGYLIQAYKTWRILDERRPDAVWIQLPPTFLVHLVLLHRAVSGRQYRIVADCHNAALRAPWTRIPGYAAALNRVDAVLAHNAEVAETIPPLGVDKDRVIVLEDRPPEFPRPRPRPLTDQAKVALVPCSFGIDEPVEALLEAARLAPEIEFKITGSLARAQARGFTVNLPENVTFTGYLPIEGYDALLANCTVLVGLTTKEGIQLSVANEGIGAGKAMVLSDTRVLRSLFGDAAVLTQNEPKALADAIRSAVERSAELETQSLQALERRRAAWSQALPPLIARLGGARLEQAA